MTEKRFTLEWYAKEYLRLSDENDELKQENQRLKHQVDICVGFRERTIKTLQGVKDNTPDNSYTSALMNSIANELGVDLE